MNLHKKSMKKQNNSTYMSSTTLMEVMFHFPEIKQSNYLLCM